MSHPIHDISINLNVEEREASEYGRLCDLDVFHDPLHMLNLVIGGQPRPGESKFKSEDDGDSQDYLFLDVAKWDLR